MAPSCLASLPLDTTRASDNPARAARRHHAERAADRVPVALPSVEAVPSPGRFPVTETRLLAAAASRAPTSHDALLLTQGAGGCTVGPHVKRSRRGVYDAGLFAAIRSRERKAARHSSQPGSSTSPSLRAAPHHVCRADGSRARSRQAAGLVPHQVSTVLRPPQPEIFGGEA